MDSIGRVWVVSAFIWLLDQPTKILVMPHLLCSSVNHLSQGSNTITDSERTNQNKETTEEGTVGCFNGPQNKHWTKYCIKW
jgi:hypothetical protein